MSTNLKIHLTDKLTYNPATLHYEALYQGQLLSVNSDVISECASSYAKDKYGVDDTGLLGDDEYQASLHHAVESAADWVGCDGADLSPLDPGSYTW
ncbi:MAG: hypothetical protein ABI670_03495 [Chloroflexota bacterium]